MAGFVPPSGDPALIGNGARQLVFVAGGVDADGARLHGQVAAQCVGWLGVAADSVSAYLLLLRAAVAARPGELVAASTALQSYAEALFAAQQTVHGLTAAREDAYTETELRITTATTNLPTDDAASTTDRLLADRDEQVASLQRHYASCLGDLEAVAGLTVVALQRVAAATMSALAAVRPADLLVPSDPAAAGALLVRLVGRGYTADTALMWQQLGAQIAARLDDEEWLERFYAAADTALLAVPAALGLPVEGPAYDVWSQVADGVLALQASGGTAALPPSIQVALVAPTNLTIAWSTGPIRVVPGTPVPPRDTVVGTISGGAEFLSVLTLLSAGSGAAGDPVFVAGLASRGVAMMGDPVFAEVAATTAAAAATGSTYDVVVSGWTSAPIESSLGLLARVPDASATFITDPDSLHALLSVDNWQDSGQAVGAVFVSLTVPVDPSLPNAEDIATHNAEAQVALMHELAVNGEAYAGMQYAARDGLVTMTAALIPDLVDRTGGVSESHVDETGLRLSYQDTHGFLEFLTTDSQDTQDLMIVTSAWTRAGIDAALAGPDAAAASSISLVTGQGAWLQGVLIDCRTDSLSATELDRELAAEQALLESVAADGAWTDISQGLAVTGRGLSLYPPTKGIGDVGSFVATTIAFAKPPPTIDSSVLEPQFDTGEAEEQLQSAAITGYQTMVAAALVESGELGAPAPLTSAQLLGYAGVPPPPTAVVVSTGPGSFALADPATLDAADSELLEVWLTTLSVAGLLPADELLVALSQGRGMG